MAQKTFVDGDVLTASDLNTYCGGEGGAWTSFTPAVVQSGSVTVTNTRSRYARYGRTIHFTVDVSVTGSGTGSNVITVSLPVTAAAANSVIGGGGYLYDSSGNSYFPVFLGPSSTTVVTLFDASTASGNPDLGGGSSSFTSGLASGDIIRISGTYEAAS